MPFYDDSTWMIVKATLARRLSCCQDFEDAVISYNTKFKDLWKRLYNCWVKNHITWAIWIVYDTIPYGINYILFDQMTNRGTRNSIYSGHFSRKKHPTRRVDIFLILFFQQFKNFALKARIISQNRHDFWKSIQMKRFTWRSTSVEFC